ncbi:MAG TPA: hypothetical protein VG939_02015 [Caulobacteraceae bacterium]|nr:hypothetical protein [Caulobacteraceae bacterium]
MLRQAVVAIVCAASWMAVAAMLAFTPLLASMLTGGGGKEDTDWIGLALFAAMAAVSVTAAVWSTRSILRLAKAAMH